MEYSYRSDNKACSDNVHFRTKIWSEQFALNDPPRRAKSSQLGYQITILFRPFQIKSDSFSAQTKHELYYFSSSENAISSYLERTLLLGHSSIQLVGKFSRDVGTIYLFRLKYRNHSHHHHHHHYHNETKRELRPTARNYLRTDREILVFFALSRLTPK